jgi:hypothetical protein
MNLNNSLTSAQRKDHNRITNTPFQGWLLTDESQQRTDLMGVPSA